MIWRRRIDSLGTECRVKAVFLGGILEPLMAFGYCSHIQFVERYPGDASAWRQRQSIVMRENITGYLVSHRAWMAKEFGKKRVWLRVFGVLEHNRAGSFYPRLISTLAVAGKPFVKRAEPLFG